jgi:hypothetical protein
LKVSGGTLALAQSRERVAALIFLSAGFEVGNLLLDLGDTGDEVMGDGVDDLVSYHGESVLEAVEATAGKRLLFRWGVDDFSVSAAIAGEASSITALWHSVDRTPR